MGFRQMTADPLQGGTAHYANADYDCTVGTFEDKQILSPDGSGFTPMKLGDIQIAWCDLPPGTNLHAGHAVTVTRNTGQVHQCQIYSVSDTGLLAHITLRDISEGA
jgi:hypothetical protein